MTGPVTAWRRSSLTVRLVVVVACAILSTVAIMGVNAVSYLRDNMLTSAKEAALLNSQAVSSQLQDAQSLDRICAAGASPPDCVWIQPRPGDFVAIASDQGRFSVYQAPRPTGPDASEYEDPSETSSALTDAQIDQLAASRVLGSLPVRQDIDGLGSFLVTSAPLAGQTGGDLWGTVYVGSSLAPTNDALLRFIRRDVLIYGALGGAVVVLTALVIAHAVRPLRRIADVADRVAAAPLSQGEVRLAERAPVADSRSLAEADRLGASVNRMLENVEASLQAREQAERSMSRFVAEASHELRNPLAAIRGYAEYAGGLPDLPPEAGSSVERIEAEALRLGALVDQLLLLARVDAGREVVCEPVDLTLVVLEVVQDCRMHWPDHAWTVDLPEDPVVVRGSEDTLRRILINLAANAGAHTPPGTAVAVSLRPVPGTDEDGAPAPAGTPSSGGWELVVSDDGPGIPEEDLPTLFDRFTQASGGEESVRDAGGSGLGLAIVRALADEAGYRVSVESHPGRTRFAVHPG